MQLTQGLTVTFSSSFVLVLAPQSSKPQHLVLRSSTTSPRTRLVNVVVWTAGVCVFGQNPEQKVTSSPEQKLLLLVPREILLPRLANSTISINLGIKSKINFFWRRYYYNPIVVKIFFEFRDIVIIFVIWGIYKNYVVFFV